MSNVLGDEKQQQIRALGRLGWTLSRIQHTTGIRRKTVSAYDPTLNPLYRDVLAYYGVVALPCRVGERPLLAVERDLERRYPGLAARRPASTALKRPGRMA